MHHTKSKGCAIEALRRERLLRGWSFKDVATGISCPDERLVRRWENGDVFPSPAYRQKLCQLFQKNAEELGLIRASSLKRGPGKEMQGGVSEEPEPLPPEHPGEEAHCILARENPEVVPKTAKDLNRQRMLERVKYIWIDGVLKHSLGSRAVIPLNMYEDRQIVENPWRLALQEVDVPAHALPYEMLITQVYNASHEELLILGEPGSGKTTLLLTLAGTLLERATYDENHPLPVVFHLASWSAKKQPLALWLIEELVEKYQVPRHLSQIWIEQDKLLLLCDGLDEVDKNAFEACLTAINSYRKDHGLVPVVICGRLAEYVSQSKRLLLNNAVIIKPLTVAQVDTYFEQGGDALAKLRLLFAKETELQELVKTPLMLTILLSTCQEKLTDIFFLQNQEAHQQQLLYISVQSLFLRRSPKQLYAREQTLAWLSWLARRMKRRGEGIFYLESLQFEDCSDGFWARHLPFLLFGLLLSSFVWLEYGLFFSVHFGYLQGILHGYIVALFTFLIYVCLNIFIFMKNRRAQTWISPYDIQDSTQRRVFSLKKSAGRLLYGLSFGLPLGLLVGLIMGLHYSFLIGLVHGTGNLFILTVDFMLLGRCPQNIQPGEVLSFSWNNVRKRLVACLSGGLTLTMVLWLFFIYEFEVIHALFLALSFGSAFTCLLTGTLLFHIFSLRNGGYAWLRHLILRIYLKRTNALPWNYSAFLNYAVERAFLRKTEGGYIFPHRLFLEYFANLILYRALDFPEQPEQTEELLPLDERFFVEG